MELASHKISATFNNVSANTIFDLAHRERKSIAHVVRDLVSEALELREDLYFSKLADKVDKNAKTYSHEEAWK